MDAEETAVKLLEWTVSTLLNSPCEHAKICLNSSNSVN